MIQENMKECWQKYAEEQSWDDVWKLVKFANLKDPWQTKETMKALIDDKSATCDSRCESDDEKLRALVDRNFFTKDQEPLDVEVEAEGEGVTRVRYSVEELDEKVRGALRGQTTGRHLGRLALATDPSR